jgi:histone methylation protein DOT1
MRNTLITSSRKSRRTPQHGTVHLEKSMTVLRQPTINAFRSWLDLNGPLLGPALYVFECVRSYIEERVEAFDARFGTDTAAPFFGCDQKPAAHFYVATTASLIYEILNSLALQPDTFAFIDMGSGKGRALHIASEFAFAKIVGIELSPHLHRIAAENIRQYNPASQQCTAFQLHCMNVADYVYGPEPLVLFLFDPFGRETFRSVVANLEASLSAKPREAFVVYVYPRFEDLLQSSRVLQKVREGGPPLRPWSRYVVYAASASGSREQGT